jgi:glycosyltransferase involved in cell wall biosynthesis
MKISGVIITYNEEKNIERCIRSLQHVCDEIIVLDSFSNDSTEEICNALNVKFYKNFFTGYTEQKNKVIEYAENDYVLSLDADEELSKRLIQSITEIKNLSLFDAYHFNRLNIYCGKKIRTTSWYPDRKIRLWNKFKGEWSGDLIHEVVEMNENSTIKLLIGDLLHYSYNTIEDHIKQVNKYSSIGAEQLIKQHKKYLLLKSVLNPIVRFLKNYFFKFGFLGGYTSFMISVIISFETFIKYSKALQLKNNARNLKK